MELTDMLNMHAMGRKEHIAGIKIFYSFFLARQPPLGQSLVNKEDSR